jgi:hypothetical protein
VLKPIEHRPLAWSEKSDLSAAKTIALDTRVGPKLFGSWTPNIRTETFQILDREADEDPIYCVGVESAPLFKKKMQQCFSFNGVPLTSPVRRNEYLIEK